MGDCGVIGTIAVRRAIFSGVCNSNLYHHWCESDDTTHTATPDKAQIMANTPGLISDDMFPVLAAAPTLTLTPTPDPRMSEIAAIILWPLFEGVGCCYSFLAQHYWGTIFAGTGPVPYDPGDCIFQVLQEGKLAPDVVRILRALRRIRNALHHRTHAEGSSVEVKDLMALRDVITTYLAGRDPDGMHLLLQRVVTTLDQALYYQAHPECKECPECGQTLVRTHAVPPAPTPTAEPDLVTFQEYKVQHGMNNLKGRRIVVKLRSKKFNGWYHGYFRSWSGTQVFVDVESLGRITAPINSVFYLE